jgi:hypothetical protein
MKPLKLFLIVSITCISIFGCTRLAKYDELNKMNLVLLASKTRFIVGEKIILTARIESDIPRKLRMYRNRGKSFSILFRKLTSNKVNSSTDPGDKDYYGEFIQGFSRRELKDIAIGKEPKSFNREIEEVLVTPTVPFILQLEGSIRLVQANSNPMYIFDFGSFGTFKKKSLGSFTIMGRWLAIVPSPEGSGEENYTGSLIVEVKEN